MRTHGDWFCFVDVRYHTTLPLSIKFSSLTLFWADKYPHLIDLDPMLTSFVWLVFSSVLSKNTMRILEYTTPITTIIQGETTQIVK